MIFQCLLFLRRLLRLHRHLRLYLRFLITRQFIFIVFLSSLIHVTISTGFFFIAFTLFSFSFWASCFFPSFFFVCCLLFSRDRSFYVDTALDYGVGKRKKGKAKAEQMRRRVSKKMLRDCFSFSSSVHRFSFLFCFFPVALFVALSLFHCFFFPPALLFD